MTRYRQRKVRDRRRTQPVYGTGDDKGVYYRCHHCGFIISKDQNPQAFEGDNAKAGNYNIADEGDTSVPYEPDSSLYLGDNLVLPEVDAAGDDKEVYIIREVAFSGCPLCGTRSNRR